MDVFTKARRSEIMSKIHSTDTKLEVGFRKLLSGELYQKGYRYRKNYRRVIGSPDIAFISQKIAIFLDGDFWHGRFFKKTKNKLSNKYWRPKIRDNINRDKKITKMLRRDGWKVVRIWEGDVNKNPEKSLQRVLMALK